ncbi:MAG: pyridoxal phosphate-dependent aminotransferase [Proteobacteria bacterium]|nr:pyridoxal phosphate-dependent aminotransferase [Pseudomonadota bacterium]
MDTQEFVKKYGIERKNTDSVKWDGMEKSFDGNTSLIPMWVADADFKCPEEVVQAVRDFADLGVYGYTLAPKTYQQAFIEWEKEQHHFECKEEWIRFVPGVVSGLYITIKALTNPGDAVIIQTPVYYPFADSVKNTNRKLIISELIDDDGKYRMDLADFEQKIIDHQVKLYILCSPHNPVARVWSEKELAAVFNICQKHNVIIVADEIHQDLVFGDHKHTTAFNVNHGNYIDSIVMLTAASKTFNIAGLKNSFLVTASIELGDKLDAELKYDSTLYGNPFGYRAAEAAYRHGKPWLNAFLKVIEENYQSLKMILSQNEKVHVYPLEGTYLCWVDLRECVPNDQIHHVVQDLAGIAVDYGEWFGDNGMGFIRINLATTPNRVSDVANRLLNAISS